MRVVGNPVEPPAGPVSGNAFRERYGLTAAPMIAYLGRITPRKEVHTLLAAFASLPDVRARLALAGDDVAASLPEIGSRVLRLPALRDAERFELLAAADVVAYPGRDEVFGLVAFEALLCGTPVVVAGDSGCGELVGELGGGLSVAPGDAAQLSAALARVLSSAEEFRQKALDAGARVRSRFSPDAVSALTRPQSPDRGGVELDGLGILRNGFENFVRQHPHVRQIFAAARLAKLRHAREDAPPASQHDPDPCSRALHEGAVGENRNIRHRLRSEDAHPRVGGQTGLDE